MKPQQLRSANWFGRSGKYEFIYRAWMKNQGIPDLYINHVQQAHLGADMDFLQGGSGNAVLRDSH